MSGLSDEERCTRLSLSVLGEPGDRVLGEAVAAIGPGATLEAIAGGAAAPASLQRRQAAYSSRLRTVDVQALFSRGHAAGARYVCPGDLEWPSQLDDLGTARPLGLWVRGAADLRRWVLRSVSIVGSRACTEYGRSTAAELSSELAERGWTVVSGGAYGIDGAVHAAALAVGGQTVAVLACGVDVAYPKGHEALLARIGEEGLLVSELPPGATVTKPRFLERNRVIAALTRGTVVVEAALRSGALSTAGRAGGLLRHVMAVPGPVTSAMSAGCHELLRTGGGCLVADAADVLDLVGDYGADAKETAAGPARPLDALGGDMLRVLEALPARRTSTPDAVVVAAGLDAPTVASCLGRLESMGLAESLGGAWRISPRRSRQ